MRWKINTLFVLLLYAFVPYGCSSIEPAATAKVTQRLWGDTEIDVLKAKTAQTYLIGHGERISMDPDLADAYGIVEGQQVRIAVKSDTSKYGMYTVYAFYEDGNDNDDVRMALDGRQRLDESDAFDGYLEATAVTTGVSEATLQSNNDYGCFLDETDSVHTGLVATAPHGGVIESYTDEQAERVYSQLSGASKDVSAWRCKGFQSAIGAFDAWHITSTEISRDSFPLLDSIGDRGFEYAVSFHGYSGSDILVGGAAPSALKESVADAIQEAVGEAYTVQVVSSGEYAGTSAANFVNWLTDGGDGGVQIEQPYGARSGYWQDIADAVADVFAALL